MATASSSQEITDLLLRWGDGDQAALSILSDAVYRDLRQLAAACLRSEPDDLTLQTGDLVQEAFLRLVDQRRSNWKSRAHFFNIAAQAMRRILVDHARKRLSAKRGSDYLILRLDEGLELQIQSVPELVALDEALSALAAVDLQQARIVELRYFAGLRSEEIALLLGISERTVRRRWRLARAWLFRQLVVERR